MYYRKFGNLGFEVSTFGMGCMRLPVIMSEDGQKKVDEKEAIRMIRYAIDHGVNYIDTAYPYHGGESELIVAKALKDGYREKTKLATKLPVWLVNSYEDFDKLLNEQLSKLEVESIDFYLLHALNKERWEAMKKLNALDFLNKAIKSGKIKYAGFSFHDDLQTFKEIIDAYPWNMCQIQLNILDENYQAGVEGLVYANKKGVPVVIMEPLKGGKLAHQVPSDIKALWDSAETKRSPVEWAFRWLYNFPEVNVILSGVSTMEQLQDNLEIFQDARPNSMTEEEQRLVHRVKELYNSKIKVGCTGCNYCMPCPSGVSIPQIFSIYNEASIYDSFAAASEQYRKLIAEGKDASQCVECGQCESACPQGIEVIEKLKEAHAALTR